MRNILKKPTQIAAVLAASGIGTDTSAAVGSGVSGAPTAGPRSQVLTFKNTTLALVDHAGVGAHASFKFFTFDLGQINITGCVVNLTEVGSSAGVVDTFNGDFGIGTVACDNSNTLSTTEQNVVASTATPAAVAKATTCKGKLTTALLVDGSNTAVDLYLNVLVDDADQDVTGTPANLVFNGTITLTYDNLGVA